MKDFDYSTNGMYFVTVCTHNKAKILCNIVGEGLCALPQANLTDIGRYVDNSIKHIHDNTDIYKNVFIEKHVIMPNHIHLLVFIKNETGGDGTPPLQNVIGAIKSYTTICYGKKLWQRSFHDHIVRDHDDYKKIYNYIENNPSRWTEDCFYTQ